MEQTVSARNPTTVKAARLLSTGSLLGWILLYVAVVVLISSGEEGHLAHQFVHPIGAGYIGSGLAGTVLMLKEARVVAGGSIIFWGYVATTCTMVVLAFPLFIPDSSGFEWYVYVMLVLLLAGVIGGSLVL
ncbi:MAG: hypothetical protein JW839_01755 [Candidatus Lokiarchaeota archaeon]|nr:hypothetical protein [Candidatus Lokiarchaeota archaeon]